MGLKRATQFKLDLTNSSLRAAMFQAIQPEQEPYFGHMVETAVSEQFGLGGDRGCLRYAHWKTSRTEYEVDFVRLDPGRQIPVSALEVKWSDAPLERPDRPVGRVAFARKNNLKRLAVTSWTKLGVRHVGDIEITYIPTALYAAASTMPLMVDEAGGPSQAHTEIA